MLEVFKNHHYGSPVIMEKHTFKFRNTKIKVCVDTCVSFFSLSLFFWFL